MRTDDEMCEKEGCTKPVAVKKRGLCKSHYVVWCRENKPRAGVTPCSIEGCSRFVYSRGYCNNHYAKLMRTGHPLGKRATAPVVICLEENCEERVHVKGRCKNCHSLWWYYNQPIRPWDESLATECSYESAHARIRRHRGHAKDHECVCGCGKQATDWALRAGTESLRFAPIGRRITKTAYSLNPFDYQPMAAVCHKAYDATNKNRNYNGGWGVK